MPSERHVQTKEMCKLKKQIKNKKKLIDLIESFF